MPQLARSASLDAEYSSHVNPQWVKLLDILGLNVSYRRCVGTELFTTDGRRILDFLSGYCVHSAGHNHPSIIAALKDELDRNGPAMLQSHVPENAGVLAKRLCEAAGGRVTKAFFASSGSEGVEAAIKFSRVYTRRTGLLYAEGAFHGLTCGALSLMGDEFWRDRFGPMLPDTAAVPFGDLAALEQHLQTKRFAAFVIEPIQGEAGIRLPHGDYLREAHDLCRRHGTLFVSDEVQTGMYRTGLFLASHHFGVEPDMVVLAKALSGGLVPCSAVLMTDGIYDRVYDSLKRAIIHTSTFSENGLAMRAGMATLDVLQREKLGDRALKAGERVRSKLRDSLSSFDMVKDVRGAGLFSGIEFRPPTSVRLRVAFEALLRIHPGLFGQLLVMRMFRDKNILTQMCGNNFIVLKVAPPLTVSDEELDEFVAAITEVVDLLHSSSAVWTEALGLARRAMSV
jgi:ornithine--oxo-acid transaminase